MNSIHRYAKYSGMALLVMLAAVILLAGIAIPAQAQNYSVLYTFSGTPEWFLNPVGQMALARDGNYYGFTEGGAQTLMYQATPSGSVNEVWSAPSQFGEGATVCTSGLTLGSDGLLYATCQTINGISSVGGGILRFDPNNLQSGATVLYTWPYCGYGSPAPNPLTLGADGNLYGTNAGNPNCTYDRWGSFYKLTTAGVFTTLHEFAGAPTDAQTPSELTLGADGNFYGTSVQGGNIPSQNVGTIFKITTKGKVSLLYSFDQTGTNPYYGAAPMTQGNNGYWYGTSFLGGTYGYGTIFELKGKTLTVLHNFDQTVDTAYPTFPLTLGTDGNFYATSQATYSGGYAPESIFEITTAKKPVYTTLFSWLTWGGPDCSDNLSNGCFPGWTVMLNPNGMFYGVTEDGAYYGGGVFYSFNTGLKPYIILQYPRGTIGNSIGIFGSGLTGTTAVSFNGVAATSFTVDSDTYMTAVIPTGATKGYVTVTTPSGSLQSAIKLTVVK